MSDPDVDIREYSLLRTEAADFLTENGFPIKLGTLAKHATLGGGPYYIKKGRRPFYSPPRLLTWARERTSDPITSTSQMQATKMPQRRGPGRPPKITAAPAASGETTVPPAIKAPATPTPAAPDTAADQAVQPQA